MAEAPEHTVNTKAGKHFDDFVITWEVIVQLHTRIYWALRAVLEETSKPPST
jgi:hypothetical protein